ncbi:hypothetical protein ACFQY5_36520 [Paeniroseomonas aquatica]|uniref:hypothetical protein n=1 Tax=Paeniroseomonas aquatica TaxID=373043 RepID=UPI00361290C7
MKPLPSVSTQDFAQPAFGSAPMNKEVSQRAALQRLVAAIAKGDGGKAGRARALQVGDLAAHVQHDVWQRRNPVHQIARHGFSEVASDHQVQP